MPCPRPTAWPVVVCAALAACGGPPQGSPYTPTAAMSRVLEERAAMNAKEPSELYVPDARDVPSLVDAEQAMPNVVGLPAPIVAVPQFSQVPTPDAGLMFSANLYRPALAKNTPVLILFTGESWATSSPAASDMLARQLATRTGDIVLAVRLRLAPEAQFPDEHEAALGAYRWARTRLREWGGDPTRVALVGTGPGGTLAAATAIAARDSGRVGTPVAMPDYLVLVTPWAGTSTGTDSMGENGGSRPLSRATVRWSERLYAGGHLDDPRMDLVSRPDLAGLPPTTVVLAQIDPTRSDAEKLASRLQAAGVRTTVHTYRGVTADFFGLGTTVPEAATAQQDVVADLQRAFYVPPPVPPAPPRRVSRSRGRR